MQLDFHSPWLALVLLPIAIGVWQSLRQRPPTLIVPSLQPFVPETGKRKPTVSLWHPLRLPLWLNALALVLLAVALVRPRYGNEVILDRSQGIDIVLAIDLSTSMNVIDVPEHLQDDRSVVAAIRSGNLHDRMQVARDALQRFVELRPHDRIGVVAFAGQSYVVCPPTIDHAFVRERIGTLIAGMLPDGTNIASAVVSGINRLKDSDARRRVLVLFTDGENNVQDAVDPLAAAQLAASLDIKIYTIGVGSRRSVVLGNTWTGQPILHWSSHGLDDQLLEKMAAVTDGKYLLAPDAAQLKQVIEEIDRMEKVSFEQARYIEYSERFMLFLAAGIACLLLAWFLEHSLLQPLP